MKALRVSGLGVMLAVASLSFSAAFAQDDEPGTRDHPMFTRMPGYYISGSHETGFDSHEFPLKGGTTVKVEGRLTYHQYRAKDGARVPSPLQTARNYQNALTRIGGVVLFDEVEPGGGRTSMKLARGAGEVWVDLAIGDSGYNYSVTIVDKGGMQQVVVASAETWKSEIHASGHAAVYGILFDTNKSDVKPESKPALDEIAKLLGKDPGLKLFVVGHTDGTGAVEANMKLSQARAESIVRTLAGSHGIAPARLRAQGVGPFSPVASNDSEDGRARNRRVELVKQ